MPVRPAPPRPRAVTDIDRTLAATVEARRRVTLPATRADLTDAIDRLLDERNAAASP